MRSLAHPAAAEELAALVVEASGRRTREEFLADVAAAAAPIDREAAGWFDSAAAPAGGPSVQRRVDRRTKRMEAYPPIDRTARPAATDQGGAGAPADARTPPGRRRRPAPASRTSAPRPPRTSPRTAAPPPAHAAAARPPTRTPGHERAGSGRGGRRWHARRAGTGHPRTAARAPELDACSEARAWAAGPCTWSGWAGPG